MKKINQVLWITILFLSFCFNAYACVVDIREAKTGAEVRCIFHELTDVKNRISFFDCDDVLHKISDAALQKKNIFDFLKRLQLEPDSLATAFKQISQQSRKEIVDVEILDLIKELQESQSPVFSLTQCTSDAMTRDQRITTLTKFGYNFSASLPDTPSISFEVDGLAPRFLQTSVTQPVYDRGVVFAGSASKGDTLKAFLNWLYTTEIEISEMKDLTIFFVDDSKPNVDVVAKACEEIGIGKFVGIHYTAVEQPSQLKTLIEPIVHLQTTLLKMFTVWVPDPDAGFFFNLTRRDYLDPYSSRPLSRFSVDLMLNWESGSTVFREE